MLGGAEGCSSTSGTVADDLPSQYNPYARTVYPGHGQEPQVIELTLGQVVDLGIWTMAPPLLVVAVSGVVVRPDAARPTSHVTAVSPP